MLPTETLDQIKQLLLTLADNGMCPPQRIYNAHRGKLPSSDSLRILHGITLNKIAAELGLRQRRPGVGVGQSSQYSDWDSTLQPLTADERLSNWNAAPPPDLPPKLCWSTSGLPVLRTYQNRRGEICHILR